MYDEGFNFKSPDLPVPAEGAYVWHLEVIVVAVGIDPVSREYETGPVADSASIKKKKKKKKKKIEDENLRHFHHQMSNSKDVDIDLTSYH
jgi:hypothetical protein